MMLSLADGNEIVPYKNFSLGMYKIDEDVNMDYNKRHATFDEIISRYKIKISKPELEIEKIKDLFNTYEEMADLIAAWSKDARNHFGESTELVLERFGEIIILFVRRKVYDDNFMEKIESICKTYRELQSDVHKKGGRLLLTTDFKSI